MSDTEAPKAEEVKPEVTKPAEKEKPRLVTETDLTKYKASEQLRSLRSQI